MKSIVLLSGGLDSAVNFKKAMAETQVVLALTFDYGQRAGWKEIEAAEYMCKRYSVAHKTVRLDWLADLSHSALTDLDTPLPRVEEKDLDNPQELVEAARRVWIPNRNGVMLSIAAAFAEANDADQVVTGFNYEEATTFPDNSQQFMDALNQSLIFSTLNQVKVLSYTAEMTKKDVVELGKKIEAPFDMIWSCYDGGEEHCWTCESCVRFKRALEETESWEWYEEAAKA